MEADSTKENGDSEQTSDRSTSGDGVSVNQRLAFNALNAALVFVFALLFRVWMRGVWDFLYATSLALVVLVIGVFSSLIKRKRFSLGSMMLAMFLLALAFAGFRYSASWMSERDRRIEQVTLELHALVGPDGAYVQQDGRVTCIVEDDQFSNVELKELLKIIDDSEDVRLSFLGLYTPQMNDASLGVVGERRHLRRLLIDGTLVSDEVLKSFQRTNPKCDVDVNVVTQKTALAEN